MRVENKGDYRNVLTIFQRRYNAILRKIPLRGYKGIAKCVCYPVPTGNK